MIRIVLLLIGYLIGCVQSAFIIGKINGIDIREHGSGNAGTTNIMRTLGTKAGIAVFVLDFLKSFITITIVMYIFRDNTDMSMIYGLYAGGGVILGHNFPFYLNFKGGKGIACSMGLICALNIWLGVAVCAFGILIAIISKYISLGSLISALIVPIIFYAYGVRGELLYMIIIFALLAIYQHRGNIVRLIKGEENKFTVKNIKDKVKK